MAVNADIYRLRGSTLTKVATNVSTPYQDPNRQAGDVYIPVPVGETAKTYEGLYLDKLSVGAVGAYSVTRRLSDTYTGSLFRVRETGGGTEADIGFNSNNLLDETALSNHVGSNDGFVTTIYDQSGNGLNITNTDTTQQPIIAKSGSIVKVNGFPSVEFTQGPTTDENDYLNTTLSSNLVQPNQHLLVAKPVNNDSYSYTGAGNVVGTSSIGEWSLDAGNKLFSGTNNTSQNIFDAVFDGASSSLNVNNSTAISGDAGSDDQSSIILGAGEINNNDNASQTGEIKVQEFIVFDTLPDRQAARDKVNDFYSTY